MAQRSKEKYLGISKFYSGLLSAVGAGIVGSDKTVSNWISKTLFKVPEATRNTRLGIYATFAALGALSGIWAAGRAKKQFEENQNELNTSREQITLLNQQVAQLGDTNVNKDIQIGQNQKRFTDMVPSRSNVDGHVAALESTATQETGLNR
jgi:hypothetical protein